LETRIRTGARPLDLDVIDVARRSARHESGSKQQSLGNSTSVVEFIGGRIVKAQSFLAEER
jgi:hypothetical protein